MNSNKQKEEQQDLAHLVNKLSEYGAEIDGKIVMFSEMTLEEIFHVYDRFKVAYLIYDEKHD